MQSPLVNPAVASFRAAKNARLFKIERSSMKIVGEYVYVLDDPLDAIHLTGRAMSASVS
jgi:hypothetical protein